MIFKTLGDRRGPFRRRVVRAGQVYPIDSIEAVLVTIRDISDRGAQIRFPAGCEVPPGFHLVDLGAQMVYACQPKYRRGQSCGVRFVSRFYITNLPPQLKHLSWISEKQAVPELASRSPR